MFGITLNMTKSQWHHDLDETSKYIFYQNNIGTPWL